MANNYTPPEPFVPPDWSGEPGPHLEQLRLYAEKTIEGELAWYIRKKLGRSKTSQRLRWSALVLTVLGGLVPLIIALFGDRPSWPWIESFAAIRFGQLGYLLLAIAAGLVLLDRFFGYSTGWMRYIVAMQAIEKAREAFRLDWVTLSRKLVIAPTQTSEHAEAIERMIQRARAAILEVKEHSEKETQAWILEFQTNLAQFEKDLKSQIEAGRPGGIDVNVVDGNKADTPVELSLDGMMADRFTGNAGSIGFVAPGLHRVSARAQKAQRDYAASALVNIAAGQICQVKLTLQIP
jgi:hypothetical protein